MGLKRWIENKTFRKGTEEEYPPIKVRFNSTYFGDIQLLRHEQTSKPIVRLVGAEFLDSSYIDISLKGARELIAQLQDALSRRNESNNTR